MSVLRAWFSRLRGLFGKQRRDREFAAELESHLRLHVEDNLGSGMTPQEARRQALLKLGGIEQTKENYRDRSGWPGLESFFQDVRFALRMMGKNPGFTAVAVMTLTLGIGANTAIFSVVNAVMVRPLPFQHPSRLMVVWHTPPQKSFPGVSRFVVSPANFLDWQSQNDVFSQMAAIGFNQPNLTGLGQPESVQGRRVSYEFFSLLGVSPVAGRDFTRAEDHPGQGNVAVLGYGVCQSHFGSPVNALGKTIQLDNKPYTVIGVMPPRFDFPFQAQVWMPLAWTDKERAVRGNHNYIVLARLKHGVDEAMAQAEMNTVSARLAQQYSADDAGWGALVRPLHELVTDSVGPALLILFGAVGLVLLIACTNIANLLLVKALGRGKEIAIRTALGASRARIIRQVFSETALLSILGGAVALLFAYFIVRVIAAFIASQLPLSLQMSPDGWVLAFTLAASLLGGFVAGVVPAWYLINANPNESLKQGTGKTSAVSGGQRARNTLVVSEVALSLALMVGAGLTIRTLYLLRSINPGIDPQHVLTVSLTVSESKYKTASQQIDLFRQVLDHVRTLPSVEAAGAVDSLPFTGGSNEPVQVEDQPVVPMADQPEVDVRTISPGYLGAMRIPLKQGRDFTDADKAGSRPVVLVSAAFAKRFWPHENPIGKHVAFTFSPGIASTVVGVVGDVKLEGLDAIRPVQVAYRPLLQNSKTTGMSLAIRTMSRPTTLTSAVVKAVHQVDPDEPVARVQTMDDIIDQSLIERRLSVILLSVFASLALLLAAIGIYGVQSYAVKHRIQEIGVRLALGAQRNDIFRLVVGQGLKLTIIGIGIGLALAFTLTRLMNSLLFGITATDPVTFAVAATLLSAVAVLAAYVPSRRAMRIDPMVVLRYE
jgi:putative ABC transport system permease protein